MANESKKFALFCCCMMTMQALRLVISTAGFCVVRFHIDCSLFNIFISRLVNAVLMSQLFGNWLGDIIVFTADGRWKLIGAAGGNWVEFGCFCSALICIMHTECGHLTGFYWSMVIAYFWWKVGEASATSIGVESVDYYFAGFTLSGVWAACLKGLVMRCVAGDDNTLHFHSDPLGDVNVKVVGARSVKTTVDYRAAKWLYIITIVLTFLMCLSWTVIPCVVGGWSRDNLHDLVEANSNAVWLDAIRNVDGTDLQNRPNFSKATVENVQTTESAKDKKDQITFEVGGNTGNWEEADQTKIKARIEERLKAAAGGGSITYVLAGTANKKVTVNTAPAMGITDKTKNTIVAWFVGVAFGGVLAVPGAMLGAGVGWLFARCFKCCLPTAKYASLTKWCQLIFGIVGAVGGIAAGVYPCVLTSGSQDRELWVAHFKQDGAREKADDAKKEAQKAKKDGEKAWWESRLTSLAAMIGLVVGLMVGLIVGVIVAFCKPRLGGSPLPAGAFFGSFFGLLMGEMVNAAETWPAQADFNKDEKDKDKRSVGLAVCGLLIVALGLGTVYSIYPGMAPCSITQFKYFNIIDICILILSAIAPIVIMAMDLAEVDERLAWEILKVTPGDGKYVWMFFGLLLLVATNICEILVLDIMQHPFSKMAKKVTTSGWRAVLLTVTMVTCQLVSTGVGFGCVAAGSGFNDGFVNVNSTLVLWTTECCGVLGEGYLTELKKYEPGKWPTQGMGKWDSYKWWNKKAFGNAWAIWCCIGTTDLRRDIMLCKQ